MLMIFHFVLLNCITLVAFKGEDDDISKRIRIHGLRIERYPINVARYKMLNHSKETPSRYKRKNLKNADRYDKFDGLTNTRLAKCLLVNINIVLIFNLNTQYFL